MSVKVTKDRLADVLKSIHQLVSKEVLIGVPDSTAGRKDGLPITNAAIGYIQENGSPINNIPARPHLVPGVESILPQATGKLQKGATAALGGDKDAAEKALMEAGFLGQNAVRGMITARIDPDLKDGTLAARRRRGHAGTTPLLETGEYRNSIIFVIRKK